MKILIVDGSRQRRHDIVEALGELTDVVISGAVGDVRSAMRAVVDVWPDVVVTGSVLPDGDATQLTERLRRLRDTPSIVVVDRVTDVRSTVEALAREGAIPAAHSLELLGRMTSAVVHDLNNYASVLEVMLTMLRQQPADATLWEQARIALDAIQRLDATLLEYARGGTPAREPVELGAITRDIMKLAGRVVPPSVTVELDITAEAAQPIRGVRSDLEQLVLNLVVNACDAMPRGGTLTVAVRRSGAGMLLEVGDTGQGHVPAPTAGPTTSTKHRGSGLGLGIVHAVLERYDGALRVARRDSGGTLVAVTLPF